jgi:hypothetical protein
MNEQDSLKEAGSKLYEEYKPHTLIAQEPETMYETAADLTFEEEFQRNFNAGISPEEFLQRMYKRINAWDWKKK